MEEGIFIHYLYAPILRWETVKEYWCGDACLEAEEAWFDGKYKPYHFYAIVQT
jgi:hypothetical protein